MTICDVTSAVSGIAQFYRDKSVNDDEATEMLRKIGITKVEYKHKECPTCKHCQAVMEITAINIGILVGKKGCNIDDLSKYLNCEIKIKEDVVLGGLYNFDH